MSWYDRIVEDYDDEARDELVALLSPYSSLDLLVDSWRKFDWRNLEEEVFNAFERPLGSTLAGSPATSFRRLALDCNAPYGVIILALHTGMDTWLPGDFSHRHIADADRLAAVSSYRAVFKLVWELQTCDEICDELEDDDVPDADDFGEAFLAAAARVARRLQLEASKHPNATGIEAIAVDHDESVETALARMIGCPGG